MIDRTRVHLLAVTTVLLTIATACAPQTQAPSVSFAPGGAERSVTSRKVITIGDSYEPKWINEGYTSEFFPAGNNIKYLVHENLIRTVQYQNYEPQLATEPPSIEKGTWKVNPNGTMQTIWHLRPNVTWQDGAPFTSADLLFTFQTKRDKEIAGSSVNVYDKLIDGVDAPDPLTFVINWNAPYVDAYFVTAGEIVPRHLLEETYLKDKFAFQASPLLGTEFIGLGPYKPVKWDRGVLFQADRFEGYYGGRPKLDTVYVRFAGDANTLVANMLSGAIDVAVSSASLGVSLEQAADVQQRWQGTGNQVVNLRSGAALYAEPQLSPLYAKPTDAVRNSGVRTALIEGVDRETLAEVMTHGLSPVPDSYYQPGDPRLPDLDPYIVKHPYDAVRAAQLLADAGWSKGADSVLVRASDGARFELEFLSRAGPNEKVAGIITDYWKRLGVDGTPLIEPEANRNDREYETKRPGYLCCIQVPLSSFYNGNSHQRQIPSAASNWVGNNHGSYVNPRADGIVDQLATILDPRARLPLEQQLVHEYTADAWLTPIWWQIFPQLVAAGVTGPNPAYQLPTMNFADWDRG